MLTGKNDIHKLVHEGPPVAIELFPQLPVFLKVQVSSKPTPCFLTFQKTVADCDYNVFLSLQNPFPDADNY